MLLTSVGSSGHWFGKAPCYTDWTPAGHVCVCVCLVWLLLPMMVLPCISYRHQHAHVALFFSSFSQRCHPAPVKTFICITPCPAHLHTGASVPVLKTVHGEAS